MPSLVFGGTTIVTGSSDTQSIMAIQQRLNDVGCGPVAIDGRFGAETFAAVEHFQARSVDGDGIPLAVDGKVGPTTWSVLFDQDTVRSTPETSSPTPLLQKVLTVAAGEVGTMEVPPGSNRGPKVDIYVSTTGLDPAGQFPWCACFVYWCFDEASSLLGVPNPTVKEAGVLNYWNAAASVPSARRIVAAEAQAQPSLIVPGTLFFCALRANTDTWALSNRYRGISSPPSKEIPTWTGAATASESFAAPRAQSPRTILVLSCMVPDPSTGVCRNTPRGQKESSETSATRRSLLCISVTPAPTL